MWIFPKSAASKLTASSRFTRGAAIDPAIADQLYLSLGLFVAATVAIGFVAVFGRATWLPNTLGIVGTVFLFYGCVMLIAETRLALRSVKSEMEFTLMLRAKYQERRDAALAEAEKEI